MENDMSEVTAELQGKPKYSDWKRFKNVATYQGIAALALVTLWAAADTWYVTTGLLIANIISILNALVAGSLLASLFHEWGHFSGARISKSYSPIVGQVKNQFMFGFNFEKNNTSQFLSISIGGPIGNWLLVILVFLLVPMDNAGRVALLAMTVAKAISVCIFEIPIILRTIKGGDPQSELDSQLGNGAGDRGQVLGYLGGALLWLVAI
jgi:hypothetical protein